MDVMARTMTVRAIVSKQIPLAVNEGVVVIGGRLDEGVGSLAAQDLELLVYCDPDTTEALDLPCDRDVAACRDRKLHTIREHELPPEEPLHPRLVNLQVVGVPGRCVPVPSGSRCGRHGVPPPATGSQEKKPTASIIRSSRWRPGGHGDQIAEAPELRVAVFRRFCSEEPRPT